MLVPIKPVKCGCGSEKFKDWFTVPDVPIIPKVSKFKYDIVYDPTLTAKLTLNDTELTTDDTINDTDATLSVEFVNHSNVTCRCGGYVYIGTAHYYLDYNLSPNESITVNIPKYENVSSYHFFGGPAPSFRIYNDNSTHAVVLSDFITSDLITSTEDEFFNTYYANWCIVDPFDDFESELKVAFMLAEDKLSAYKAQLTDFNPGAHTVMTVDYGERGNTDYGYRYPIGGDVDTSAPNTGAKSTVNEVTDTTTVDKNEEPFKNLDKTKAMDGWLRFFVDQFKDCFTLCEGMTW